MSRTLITPVNAAPPAEAPPAPATLDEIADAVRQDSAQGADYIAESTVPFGGE
jgi:hypothetical protein